MNRMELEAVYSAAPSAEVYNQCIRSNISLYGTFVQSVTGTVFFIRVLRFSPISIFHQCSILIYSSHRCHIVLTIDIVIT